MDSCSTFIACVVSQLLKLQTQYSDHNDLYFINSYCSYW